MGAEVAQAPTASVMESEESHQLPLARLSLLGLGLCVITGLGAATSAGNVAAQAAS
jgi:F0F1-type ATP synthase membrane subunit c/vacuolar-type H+-ATPase subunit K